MCAVDYIPWIVSVLLMGRGVDHTGLGLIATENDEIEPKDSSKSSLSAVNLSRECDKIGEGDIHDGSA